MNGLFVAGRCFGYNLWFVGHGKILPAPSRATTLCHHSYRYVCGYRTRRPHSDSRRSTSHTRSTGLREVVWNCTHAPRLVSRVKYRTLLSSVRRLPIAASASPSAEKFGGVINGAVWELEEYVVEKKHKKNRPALRRDQWPFQWPSHVISGHPSCPKSSARERRR